MRKTTDFIFYRNTPFLNFNNTIHFKSNEERDNFFLHGNHYDKLPYTLNTAFNFVRDRSALRATIPYHELAGVNYCTFFSEFDNVRMYAYVTEYKYISDGVTEISLLIDPVMTYTQGDVLNTLINIDVKRQHLTQATYEQNLKELKNNDDVLQTKTLSYFYEDLMTFDDFNMIIVSAVNLYEDFGTMEAPRVNSPFGTTFDGITSPLDLYIIPRENFDDFMRYFIRAPWITQNFLRIVKYPKGFISNDDIRHIDNPLSNHPMLYTPRKNFYSDYQGELYDGFNKSMSELYEIFGIDEEQEAHLLRSEYCTAEFYAYDGNELLVDLGQLDEETGIVFEFDSVLGYENKLAMYPKNYRVSDYHRSNNNDPKRAGSYLNDSLIFDKFDEIPVLLDTANYNKAMTAYQRSYQEDQYNKSFMRGVASLGGSVLTGLAVGGVAGGAIGGISKISEGFSLLTNNPVFSLGGMVSDRNSYYEGRKADEQTLKLQASKASPHTNNYALQEANGNFGVTCKFSRPEFHEREEISKYYKALGFKWERENDFLDDVHSMSICNYVQFSGNWQLPNVDIALNKVLQGIFESGVTLWHNDNTGYPMIKDVYNNRRIL